MVKWLTVGFIVVILLTLLVWRGAKGPVRTLATLEHPIDALLKRGYDGGFLIIDISYSRKFVQLRKYINAPGDYGIVLAFPKAKWSLKYYDELAELCNKVGVEYEIETKQSNMDYVEFLIVDFGKDSTKAHKFVVRLLTEVFDVDEDVKLFARLEDAALEDRLIDREGL